MAGLLTRDVFIGVRAQVVPWAPINATMGLPSGESYLAASIIGTDETPHWVRHVVALGGKMPQNAKKLTPRQGCDQKSIASRALSSIHIATNKTLAGKW
ncbi:hypothetical protein [Shimia sagamensis]|uniref:hypothetical protein n=1 Tax=Shimia sagamensis TaxID=1566352 RepID=UPI0024B638B3|nr:hypothetical protein [Shimia sagamensis]